MKHFSFLNCMAISEQQQQQQQQLREQGKWKMLFASLDEMDLGWNLKAEGPWTLLLPPRCGPLD